MSENNSVSESERDMKRERGGGGVSGVCELGRFTVRCREREHV